MLDTVHVIHRPMDSFIFVLGGGGGGGAVVVVVEIMNVLVWPKSIPREWPICVGRILLL